MTSRGIRNHNPGNLRKSADKWQGLAEHQPDSEFFTFKAPEWGIRALCRTLITYYDKYDLDTISKIINRWAPPVENDTDSYIASVSSQMGVHRDANLDLHIYGFMLPLVKAIILHENGSMPYSLATLNQGLRLAGIEPPKSEQKAALDQQRPLSTTRTMKATTVAAGATAVSAAVEAVQPALEAASPFAGMMSTLAQYAPYALAIIILAALAYVAYARLSDRREAKR